MQEKWCVCVETMPETTPYDKASSGWFHSPTKSQWLGSHNKLHCSKPFGHLAAKTLREDKKHVHKCEEGNFLSVTGPVDVRE